MDRNDLPGKKRSETSTARRQSRSLAAQEFNALSFEERLVAIHGARGRQKYNLPKQKNWHGLPMRSKSGPT